MASRVPVRTALLAAAAATFMHAAAQPAALQLEWVKPSLVGQPAARTGAAMVYDAAMGATLLYGGNTYNTLFGDTWAFTIAKGWTQLTSAVSPPPLQGASMAYDPTTQTVVLFGGNLFRIGQNGGNSNQTWTWDGVTWTQQFPPVSPPARSWNATNGMVFDAQLGLVVMFGGYTPQFVIMDDTWVWNGQRKTWRQVFTSHAPSPRTATLAYDEATKQVVLFGGWTNGISYGDTWAFNGLDWVEQQPATSPQARADNGLAYDPILKNVVLYGGLAGPCEDCGEGRLNDTWLWNGKNWSQVQTSVSPHPSSGVAFSFDGSTNRMLLFGGWTSDFQFTNSTWIFGPF